MKKLKCYVGIDDRFVMCEKFPNDQEHFYLNDLLEEFVQADIYIGNNIKPGFYLIDFRLEEEGDYLEIEELIPVDDIPPFHIQVKN